MPVVLTKDHATQWLATDNVDIAALIESATAALDYSPV
jgi:hypothetical protein